MKYTLEIEIDRPRAQLVELFENPDNWSKWQDSLVSFEPVHGEPGTGGSVTKLVHKLGRREIEMTETVESSNLPDDMTCRYESTGAWNRVIHRFYESARHKTRWEFETEFRCTGILYLMALVMPGMFRKASWKDMTRFKEFAESSDALNEVPSHSKISAVSAQ